MPFEANVSAITVGSSAASAQDRLAILFDNGHVLVLKRPDNQPHAHLAYEAEASTPELVDDICQTVSGWFRDPPAAADVRRELEVRLHGQNPRFPVGSPLVVEVYYKVFRHMPYTVAQGSPIKDVIAYSDVSPR
jgi:hypothetical protein